MRLRAGVAAVLLLVLAATGQARPQESPTDYAAGIQKRRHQRVDRLKTGDFSPLKKIGSHRIPDTGRVTVGSAAHADIRVQGGGIAPVHIVIEGTSATPVLRASGGPVFFTWDNSERDNWTIRSEYGFRMGRYNILYWVSSQGGGRFLQVFDPDAPRLKRFRGLEFFAVDPSFRLEGQIEPAAKPERVQLLDSAGREQAFWIYGHLSLEIGGKSARLELYSEGLQPDEIRKAGFNLMFTDGTSGKETYPAARYLAVEGKLNGPVTVDFNLATSPPCVFSPLYSCPYPRKQNRLPVPIRAGEKWYRDPGDEK